LNKNTLFTGALFLGFFAVMTFSSEGNMRGARSYATGSIILITIANAIKKGQ